MTVQNVKKCDKDDEEFFQWVNEHPEGYVINTERRTNSRLTFLHRSGCFHISGLAAGHRPDAYTKYEYIKVCSTDPLDLRKWCIENRHKAEGFSSYCKTCNPEPIIQKLFGEIPKAIDIAEPDASRRVLTETYRILLDTKKSKHVKALYDDRCQICGQSLELAPGITYSEAHHIKPLGEDGPDVEANILCVCPNHHVLLDYAAMPLDKDSLHLVPSHHLGDEYICFHNQRYRDTLNKRIALDK